MAISKYLDSKRAASLSDAVKMFIRKDIIANFKEIKDKWQGFREKKLWTLEVNEVFESNKA